MSELSVGIVNDPELATLIEATDTDSLSCTYDEETRQIEFNWDADKNPEYNYLLSMTSEELNYLLSMTSEELIEKMLRWSISEDAAVSPEVE